MVQEIDTLKKTLFPAVLVFALSFIILMVFKFDPLPHPAIDSISLSIFNKIQHDLLPKDIKILITDPLHALLVQIDISLFFAFLISLPVLLYQTTNYLAPALRKNEKRVVQTFVVPTAVLFFLGCFVGYYFLVPSVIKLLNSYAVFLNATTYFEINKFISFVILFTFITGVAFTMPVLMKLLAMLGVDRSFWVKNIKLALLIIAVVAFILTPDLTTMFLVSSVLLSLYALGYYLS